MTQDLLNYLQADEAASLGRLKKILAIPSIGTDPQYKPQVAQTAEYLTHLLAEAGFSAKAHPTAGHPIVLATNDTSHLPDNAPSLLFYGHYDVQPPDPIDKWETPPFEPTIRNGAIYARGASDDKGQVLAFIEALRAWHQVHGKLPLKITVLIEGEEESSSANLAPFLHAHQEQLRQADVVLICDTTMWNASTVAITYGLRGLLYFDIKLHNSSRDLHSGVYGGTLANPCNILTQTLARLFDHHAKITLPGFYDGVEAPNEQELKQWERLAFDEHRDLLDPIGVKTPYGEEGYSTLMRKWARPSCDINGLYGGYGGHGAKTVIPAMAGAKVSFRLAPGQNPVRIAAIFEKWLRSQPLHGCRLELTPHGQASPVLTSTSSPFIHAAQQAIQAVSGKPAVLVREGATIPVVSDFKTILDLDSILVGFGLNDDCIHSPNEKLDLACYELGKRTLAIMLGEMAKVPAIA